MKRGIVCFTFCVMMASSVDIVMKLASFQSSPLQLAFWRFLLGGLACLPMAVKTIRTEKLRLSLGSVGQLLVSGCICVVLSTGLYQTAIAMGKASIVSILYCCNPLFIAAFAWWLLRERMTKGMVLASFFYIGGIAVILFDRGEQASIVSCVFTLMASALLALYNVLGQRWIHRYPPVVYVTFSFLAGSLELLALAGLSHLEEWAQWAQCAGLELLVRIPVVENLTGAMIPTLVYIGIVATGLNYLAMQVTTRELGANTMAMIFYFKLILAPLLAWLILGERLEWSTVWSILLIFIAIGCKMTDNLWQKRSG